MVRFATTGAQFADWGGDSRRDREVAMSEVLVRYVTEVTAADGTRYTPQACGGLADDGLWEGWIEFISGPEAMRTGRETEQPNRDALMYWAQGLTDAYLEGAFARATRPSAGLVAEPALEARFDGPKPHHPRLGVPSRAILDPFATFAQGENLLRGQLGALSRDNLIAIVEDYGLVIYGAADMSTAGLADAIVEAVRNAYERRPAPERARADFAETPAIQPDDRAR
jgi:hypothetical protein